MPPGLFNAQKKIEPCDPCAAAPADLGEKVRRYQILNTSDLRQGMGQTAQDYAIVDERPVIARFALESAAAKYREFVDDVVKRTGMPLRQGLIELREHGAVITEDQARALIAKWNNAQAAGDSQGLPEDEDILLQYELLIAFPFLDAAGQIEILLAMPEHQPLLLELVNETKMPNAQTLEQFTEEAVSSGDEYALHLLLEIAAVTGAELADKIRALACSSVSSPAERLRSRALGLAARSGHPDLLKAVAESESASDPLEDKNSTESWYGSLALLKAVQAGLIDASAALDRVSPRLYGRAAVMLDGPAVQKVVRRIDASMRCAAGLPDALIAPEIELKADQAVSDEPILFL